ncbi:MAG: YbaB/EbfC family nucleoid-associated protein [Deltaproteobacteria bacterium HGW-Deltaproteobacteria-14]|jgi:hypothetical protein|nr:MAG: YbaB/EbfC family nucleoid-associated protein [Deltaproteobacteria bacterium HGW-Deltaproteobacteria-14]
MNLDELLGGANLEGLMQQAQQMQEQVKQAQARAEKRQVVGEAGGGIIKVTANGRLEILSVQIDPVAATGEDLEMLQDLVTAAVNDALRRAKETVREEMGPMADAMKASGLGGF